MSEELDEVLSKLDVLEEHCGLVHGNITKEVRKRKKMNLYSLLYSGDLSINVGTAGHIDHGAPPLTDVILRALQNTVDEVIPIEDNDSCKGNFNKVTKGKHTYPFWNKSKY